MNEPKRPASDAEWYCRKDPEADRFYEIFFKMCRKYHVSWCSASEKERLFIEEVSRVTYERDRKMRFLSAGENRALARFFGRVVSAHCIQCYQHISSPNFSLL